MLQLNNMINGKLVPSESGEKIEVFNPFNQEVVGTVPKSTKNDVDDALRSSKKAQKNGQKYQLKEEENICWKLPNSSTSIRRS